MKGTTINKKIRLIMLNIGLRITIRSISLITLLLSFLKAISTNPIRRAIDHL